MRSSRAQYGGEGYITSSIAIFVSSAFLLMIKANSLFEKTLHKRIAIGISIAFAFAGIITYVSCYRIKTPWYQNNFWPPPNYMKGPLMRDQGNNI
mmetsp:Transcript_34027/g.41972  ORF Transcript_34027/g.41972 Transcript_34027/m.41972 type:complete len:95 (-) Transcript_34027:69-353(-)